jgi:predicted dehydrogenase
VVALADLDPERARTLAAESGVPVTTDLEGLLANPGVELVLNLTTPLSHFPVAKLVLEAGKHVYNEKPLAIDVSEADELLALAKSRGLQVGCAPDTVLGAGIQTCRELIDEGAIGEPLSFQAFMMCPGHEGWHPDPEFYYQKGGGPLFDMGPYYVSAIVTLLGPVARVCGAKKKSFAMRTIGSEPKKGQMIEVEVPTHLITVMEMGNGTVGQLTTSFDVQCHTLPHLEIYGSEGTMRVPDPNGFSGPVQLRRRGDDNWRDVPVTRPYAENSRGLGVVDLVQAIGSGRVPRASGAMGRHALAVFHAAHRAPHIGQYVEIEPIERPQAMPR